MVSFHPEIPYAEAQRRGAVQSRILDELDSGGNAGDNPGGVPAIDLARADALVLHSLTEIA